MATFNATAPQVLETYTLLQIAAEAFLGTTEPTDPAKPPAGIVIDLDAAMLTRGNKHSSRMTTAQAAQFTSEWEVISHQPSTATGFSATLFRCKVTDPARGMEAGKYVMSMRSTEFIEDSARDSKATNELEIKETGWAFGQIADMEAWWQSLPADVRAGQVDVTGYSLGGHLATAFYLMHPDQVKHGYTFNGAGVGKVTTGTLSEAIAAFASRSASGSNRDLFSNAGGRSEYELLVQNYSSFSVGVTAASARADAQRMLNIAASAQTGSDVALQYKLLHQALSRIGDVAAEAERMANVAATDGTKPALVLGASNIAALRLDHQLAVLKAAQRTSPHYTGVASGGFRLLMDMRREEGPNSSVFFDVYGKGYPSMVANSQVHHGRRVPVFIEDQPDSRGSVVGDVVLEGMKTGEVRLLQNGYDKNDFGDTHSIALLADSLRVQAALAALTPASGAHGATLGSLAALFPSAGKAKAGRSGDNGGQGWAEGDTVEQLLDSARRVLLGPDVQPTLSDGQRDKALQGGTWADWNGEQALRNRLEQSVMQLSGATGALKGKLRIEASSAGMNGRGDFSAFLSLYGLSTIRFSGADAAGAAALRSHLQSRWGELFSQWEADQALPDALRSFSDQWLADRGAMLSAVIQANVVNQDRIAPLGGPAGFGGAERLQDVTLKRDILLSNGVGAHIRFGSADSDAMVAPGLVQSRFYGGAGSDSLTGGRRDDHLEGGDGSDVLLGGGGTDVLRGGADADTLDGGEGNDHLRGGTGVDTYKFAGDFGLDTITDQDGRIEVTGLGVLSGQGAKKLSPSEWRSEDGKTVYLRSGADLHITVKAAQSFGTVVIKDWQAGSFGIQLGSQEADKPSTVIAGDVEAIEQGGSDDLLGSAGGEYIVGKLGQDFIRGFDGDDRLEGEDGIDVLAGGTGADTLVGGAGSDFLLGSAEAATREDVYNSATGRFEAYNGAKNFTSRLRLFEDYHGSSSDVVALGRKPLSGREAHWLFYTDDAAPLRHSGAKELKISWGLLWHLDRIDGDAGNVLDGGAGDDFIYAGTGADFAIGGLGDDELYGMAGNDTLTGDDGADLILGDGDPRPNIGEGGHDFGYSYAAMDQQGNDQIDGGSGNDSISGSGGNDVLFGGSGDDDLQGDWSEDWTIEVAGLEAYDGDDYLDGGEGKDTLVGAGGDDELLGGTENDALYGDYGRQETMGLGINGDDSLHGGGGHDTLVGGLGNDTLNGGEGDDQLDGDYFAEWGGAAGGDDVLEGGGGNDMLRGGDGRDTLAGGEGLDLLFGGQGDDMLLGDGGDDELSGEEGSDYLEGGAGNDALSGGAGDDTLDGGLGRDHLAGGSGNDTYLVRAGETTGMAGGLGEGILDAEGSNRVVFAGGATPDLVLTGAAGVNIFFSNGMAAAVAGQTYNVLALGLTTAGSMRSFDFDFASFMLSQLIGSYSDQTLALTDNLGQTHLMGSKRADELTPMSAGTRVSGGQGDDRIDVSSGGLTIWFDRGDGRDTLLTGQGALSAMSGGMSPASATSSAGPTAAANILELGAGLSSADLQLWVDSEGALVLDLSASGSYFGDGIRLQGTNLDDLAAAPLLNRVVFDGGTELTWQGLIARGVIVEGIAAAESRQGTSASDLMLMSAGNDTLAAGAGSDTYEWGLGSGADELNELASPGDIDTLKLVGIAGPADIVVERSGDDLLLRARQGSDSMRVVGQFAGTRIERLVFANGQVWGADDIAANAAPVLGTEGNDQLTGTASGDVLSGLGGNDYMFGQAGNDTLLGGDGDDRLFGDDGNDVLDGGAGSDLLYGGAGDDMLRDGSHMQGNKGSDTYVLSTWPTDDVTISENGEDVGDTDVLVLPADVRPADLELMRSYNSQTGASDDLRLSVKGKYAAIRLDRFLHSQNSSSRIERVQFSDNTVWSVADLIARVNEYRPSEDWDVLSGFRWSETIDGLGGSDRISGGLGDDVLRGGAGNDTLYGDERQDAATAADGNDTLEGGAGDDSLVGGGGNDTYLFGRAAGSDIIVDSAGSMDRLKLAAGIAPTDVQLYGDGASLWLVIDNGATQLRVSGHFINSQNTLESIEFDDRTVWDAGTIALKAVNGRANTQSGSASNDVFVVDSVADVIVEGINQGVDTVMSSVSFGLSANVENLTLTGPLHIDATGNSLGNALKGNAGNNVLNGNGGADTLIGGAGDDTYEIDNYQSTLRPSIGGSDDLIIETANGGYDTVYVKSYNYKLTANVERLISIVDIGWLDGATHKPIQMILEGNDLDNYIDHQPRLSGSTSTGAWIDGGLGADTMVGDSREADTFVVDNAGDVVFGSAGDGDTVNSFIDYQLDANIENLKLIGSVAITGRGNDGANRLDGSENSSANLLIGGKGDDTYVVDATQGDMAVEAAGEGVDTLRLVNAGGLTINLASGFANVENVEIANNSVTLIGSEDANRIAASGYYLKIAGGGGDDVIEFKSGSSGMIVDGGAGNDTVWGLSSGTLKFGLGSGFDVMKNNSADYGSKIQLGEGVTLSDLTILRSETTLVLTLASNDSLAIENLFPDATSTTPHRAFAGLVLASGVTVSAAFVMARLGTGNSNVSTPGGDSFVGTHGADALSSAAGNDTIFAGSGNDIVDAGDDNDEVHGEAGNDSLIGGAGNDLLFGGDGDDTLVGGVGDEYGGDELIGGSGSDLYQIGSGHHHVRDSGGTADEILLPAGLTVDMLQVRRYGSELRLSWLADANSVSVDGFFTPGADTVETVRFNDGTVWNRAELELRSRLIDGSSSADYLYGNETADLIRGHGGDDRLDGNGGNDTLIGGSGNDTLWGSGGNDTLIGGSGNDSLHGGEGDDLLEFGRGDGIDTIEMAGASRGINTLRFAVGIAPADVSYVRVGNDLELRIAGGSDKVIVQSYFLYENPVEAPFNPLQRVEFAGTSTVWTEVQFQGLVRKISGTSGNDTLTGTANGERLVGMAGNDTLRGNGGDDWLEGGLGDDSLDGGTGDDFMLGGAGDDSYLLASLDDQIIEKEFEGYDRITSGLSFLRAGDTYTMAEHVEEFVLTGSVGKHVHGNAADNKLTGSSGNDSLYGAIGNDTLIGAAGSDQLAGGAGDDLLEGQDGDDSLSDDGGVGILRGGAGVDYLSASGSPSSRSLLSGGADDDTIVAKGLEGSVRVVLGGSGNDRVEGYSDLSGTLLMLMNRGDGADELLPGDWAPPTVVSLGGGIQLSDVQIIDVDRRADWEHTYFVTLGLGGSDSLRLHVYSAATGSDGQMLLQVVDGSGVAVYDLGRAMRAFLTAKPEQHLAWPIADELATQRVFHSANEAWGGGLALQYGRGTALDGLSPALLHAYLSTEGLASGPVRAVAPPIVGTGGADVLAGAELDDQIRGLAGNDTLMAGADWRHKPWGVNWQPTTDTDSLLGGSGDDVYVIDSKADVIVEDAGAGIDTVYAPFDYSLAALPNVENLTLGLNFADAHTATGNSLANRLVGNAVANVLDGGAGTDALEGGAGNDTLEGGAGDDTLTGGTLGSGQGNDTYVFRPGFGRDTLYDNDTIAGNKDVVQFEAGIKWTQFARVGGDMVVSVSGTSDQITIKDWFTNANARIEEFRYSDGTVVDVAGVASRLTANLNGDAAANSISGYNDASNRINGLAGNDSLVGGARRDVLDGGDGNDSLTGLGGDDELMGDVGNDFLSGGGGLDTLDGGLGDDSLEGGEGADWLLGREGADTLIGGAGPNYLIGGLGNDLLNGGDGADNYIFYRGDGADRVIDYGTPSNYGLPSNLIDTIRFFDVQSTEVKAVERRGRDLVIKHGSIGDQVTVDGYFDAVNSAAYAIEAIYFNDFGDNEAWYVSDIKARAITHGTSSADTIVGYREGVNRIFGYEGHDKLVGAEMGDVLDGGLGNDTLDGGAGNDSLIGGTGADSYVFGRGYGADRVTDNDATAGVKDAVLFGAGIAQSDVAFTRSGNALVASILGSSDALTIQDWYLGSQNRIEEFRFLNGPILTDIQAQSLVGAMAAFSPAGANAQYVPYEEARRQSQIAVSAFG